MFLIYVCEGHEIMSNCKLFILIIHVLDIVHRTAGGQQGEPDGCRATAQQSGLLSGRSL